MSLYEGGMSAQMLADYFAVSIGAIYYVLRHNNIPRRTARHTNAIRFAAKPLSYEIKHPLTDTDERLKLGAIVAYWGEGYKVGKNCIDFANSDPDMALLFRRFLSEICRVDESRIRASLYCYEGQDVTALTSFWSSYLSIPKNQFIKPYVKKQSKPGPRGQRMSNGLVHVRYCDTKLLRQILAWIDEYRVECVGGGVVNRERL